MSSVRALLLRWLPPFLLTAGGLIAVNLLWLIPAVQNIRASASILALEVASRIQSTVVVELESARMEMEAAAEEIAVEPERTELTLRRLLRRRGEFARIAVVQRTGQEQLGLEGSALEVLPALVSHARDPHFYIALQGAPSFGNIIVSPQLEPQTTLAVPVWKNGRVEEVLIANVNLRNIMRAVRAVTRVKGQAYIVDRGGLQIIHPDPNQLLRRPDFSGRPIVQKVIVDGKTVDGLAPEDGYIDERGERIFAVGLPIPGAGLGLILEQLRQSAFAGERQMFLFAGATLFLGMAIFAIIFGSNIRMARVNAVLEERNQESAVSAKILVRRDRELVFTNTRLRELLVELEDVGKMLVRRDLELTRANARLEELDQVKSEFVSIAAHQLRTPLTGIRWSYQTLLDKGGVPMTHEQRRLMESGLGATLRMIELVNDLLSVARIEEGKFGIRLRKQSIMPVIEGLAGRYEALTKNKGVAFALEVPKGEPLPDLAFDEEKITLVIDNILDNALKYTEPGGKVALRVMLEDSRIKIEIQDSGIGIPQAQIHRVFTKFFRADNAVRLHTDGTGLGLYVAKNIIENHNGTVEARSEEGKGSVFSVTLPTASF